MTILRCKQARTLGVLTWLCAAAFICSAQNAPPQAVSVTPSSGSGSSQMFSFVFSDPNGFTDLSTTYMGLNATLTWPGGCYTYYDRNANALWLLNDPANLWLGPVTPGAATSLQNSQCTLSAGGSSASGSGNNLTVNVALSFNSAFGGAKNIYMCALDNSGASSNWQQRGAWTVPNPNNLPPTVVSVTPSSGSGSSQTFSFVFSDGNGFTDLSTTYIGFNSTLTWPGGCYTYYDRNANALWLLNDPANLWLGPVTPGAATSLQNSQCTLSGAGSSVSGSGNNLTVNVALSFNSAFGGAKNIYMCALDNSGASSNWQQRGAWTVQTLSVACSASPITAVVGQSVTFQANPSGGTGYTYSWSGSPGTWTPSPSNSQAPSYQFSAAGSYTATVTVRDNLNRQAQGSCPVTLQDFSVSAPSQQYSVLPGGNTQVPVTITAMNGFNSQVMLNYASWPQGFSASFNPDPASGSSSLIVSVAPGTAAQTQTLQFSGTAMGVTRTGTVRVSVSTSDFTLSAAVTRGVGCFWSSGQCVSPSNPGSPPSGVWQWNSPLTIPAGGGESFSAIVQSQNGFSGPVTLSATSNPSGLTVNFELAPGQQPLSSVIVTPQANGEVRAIVLVNASANATSPPYSVTLRAADASGSDVHTTTFQVATTSTGIAPTKLEVNLSGIHVGDYTQNNLGDLPNCSTTATYRTCYQEMIRSLVAQGVSGVRFLFTLGKASGIGYEAPGAFNYDPRDPAHINDSSINGTWSSNLGLFFQDLYDGGSPERHTFADHAGRVERHYDQAWLRPGQSRRVCCRHVQRQHLKTRSHGRTALAPVLPLAPVWVELRVLLRSARGELLQKRFATRANG
jgi:PKD domain